MAKKKAKVLFSQSFIVSLLLIIGLLLFIPSFIVVYIFLIGYMFLMMYEQIPLTLSVIFLDFLYLAVIFFFCRSIYYIGKLLYFIFKKKKLPVVKWVGITLLIFSFLTFLFGSTFAPRQFSLLFDTQNTLEADTQLTLGHDDPYFVSAEYNAYVWLVGFFILSVWIFGTCMFLLAGLHYLGILKTSYSNSQA